MTKGVKLTVGEMGET